MSFTRRYLLCTTLAALCLLPLPRPAVAQTVIKASDLQTDVALLRRVYETMHPGLYRYNTKPQMDRLFDDLAKQLNHDQSRESAYLAISIFLAKIKCGTPTQTFIIRTKQ